MPRTIVTTVVALLVLLPAAAIAQAEAAEPLPTGGTALEPGRYVTSAVGPSIEFRAGEGWLVNQGPDGGPIFTLERTDPPGQVLTVTRFDGEAFVDSCDPTSLTTVDPGVQRLIEIVAGNPFLSAGPSAPIEVSGYQGLSLDVATPMAQVCPRPLLLLWALPVQDGEFVQVPGQQSRFIVLDVEGDIIVIAIESFPGVPFGGLLERSMDLVESMRIEPGEAEPSPGETASPRGDRVHRRDRAACGTVARGAVADVEPGAARAHRLGHRGGPCPSPPWANVAARARATHVRQEGVLDAAKGARPWWRRWQPRLPPRPP